MTDDWDEAPDTTGLPDEVRTSDPDGVQVDDPDEDDPSEPHIAPVIGD